MYLGSGVLGELGLVELLRDQAKNISITDPAGPPRSLITTSMAGPYQLQVLKPTFGVVVDFLSKAEINNVLNPEDSDGALCNVGGHDNLAPPHMSFVELALNL